MSFVFVNVNTITLKQNKIKPLHSFLLGAAKIYITNSIKKIVQIQMNKVGLLSFILYFTLILLEI